MGVSISSWEAENVSIVPLTTILHQPEHVEGRDVFFIALSWKKAIMILHGTVDIGCGTYMYMIFKHRKHNYPVKWSGSQIVLLV